MVSASRRIGLVDAGFPPRLGLDRSSNDSHDAGDVRHAGCSGDGRDWRVRRAHLGPQQPLSTAYAPLFVKTLSGQRGVVLFDPLLGCAITPNQLEQGLRNV